MEIINLFALLFSPLIAVLVSVFLQSNQAKYGEKKVIFSSLIETRHSPINDQTVRALNMIDVVFYKNKNVRRL